MDFTYDIYQINDDTALIVVLGGNTPIDYAYLTDGQPRAILEALGEGLAYSLARQYEQRDDEALFYSSETLGALSARPDIYRIYFDADRSVRPRLAQLELIVQYLSPNFIGSVYRAMSENARHTLQAKSEIRKQTSWSHKDDMRGLQMRPSTIQELESEGLHVTRYLARRYRVES